MIKINLSPSFLSKVYSKGYDYAVAEKLHIIPRVDTAAMKEGRLFHALVAESFGGDKADVVMSPYDNYRTKEARDWRDAQTGAIVTKEHLADLTAVVDRIHRHPDLADILSGRVETEKVVTKSMYDNTVKGIIDAYAHGKDTTTVVDWKFVSSLEFDDFGRKFLRMNYDLQAAVYDYLLEPTNVYFVAVESQFPFRIQLWHCDQSALDSGADKFNKTFQILKEANWREPDFNLRKIGELVDWSRI